MNAGKTVVAFAASAFIWVAAGGAASAQTAGIVYVFHSAPAGTCPALDWHIVMSDDNTLSGMIAWDNMKSMARVEGPITMEKAFHLDAKEIGGAGKTAVVDGKLIPGWLLASIKGPGIDCQNIKIAVFRPSQGQGGD
jgi:hypothetical protein